MKLESRRIAILTANEGVEQVELTHPREALERAGAEVTHLCPQHGEVQAFTGTDKGDTFQADGAVAEHDPRDFDALVLPGGYINPDKLRRDADAVAFTRAFFDAGRPVGVICHGPWTLIEADAVRGRTLTSVPSLQTDIRNAGGQWVDEDVHVDRSEPSLLVSGRDHEVVDPFASTLVEELARTPVARR